MATVPLRLLGFAVLTSGLLCFTACNKDNDAAPENLESAEDSGNAEDENAAIGDIIEVGGPDNEKLSNGPVREPADAARVWGTCATRTYNAETRTLTIDFGSTNCLCPNGKTRRGKIIVVFGGPYRLNGVVQAGASATVSLVNYFVNDKQHTGTRVFTSLGSGSFTLDVQNASIITPDGTHSWTSQRTYTRTAGFGTTTIQDDKYQVSGQASGTNRKGVGYTAQIQQPLVKSFALGCARHFTAGTVNISNSKGKSLVLNYDPTGSEACDNIASVTVNGVTRTIRLR
ncbi:hypothetical protein [Hymenobacter cellulosivorans]|uniref:Lipoprotein n=1 Tax=Hymenobacter cellulosivorans TaxID=2932249 RepID=A0ABY4FCB2_9BACT|nr:hypothetical protein [Hymenobacter cellulosivorans]UOQ54307.1 hypothetical protein MUN80_05995 [Hymenobacter cellulosivorans]